MNITEEFVPIYPYKIPSHVYYAKHLPTESQPFEVEKIPVSTFEKMIEQQQSTSFRWTEEVWVRSNQYLEKNSNQSKVANNAEMKIREALKKPVKGLVICKTELVGNVVVTQKEIKAGTIVAKYAGTLLKGEKNKGSDYRLVTVSSTKSGSEPEDEPHIDAKYCGNIARFFVHLPYSKEQLRKYDLDPTILDQVAESNIESIHTNLNGFPITYFIALRDIKPNELVGFSYGSSYWDEKPYFCLFNKKAEIIEIIGGLCSDIKTTCPFYIYPPSNKKITFSEQFSSSLVFSVPIRSTMLKMQPFLQDPQKNEKILLRDVPFEKELRLCDGIKKTVSSWFSLSMVASVENFDILSSFYGNASKVPSQLVFSYSLKSFQMEVTEEEFNQVQSLATLTPDSLQSFYKEMASILEDSVGKNVNKNLPNNSQNLESDEGRKNQKELVNTLFFHHKAERKSSNTFSLSCLPTWFRSPSVLIAASAVATVGIAATIATYGT